MPRVGQKTTCAVLLLMVSCASSSTPHGAGSEPSATQASAMPAPAPQAPIDVGAGAGKPRLLATMAYECEDSSYVVAQLDDATGGLWLFLPEETVLLPRVVSASGTHYSNGVVSLWSKGISATIETRQGPRRCVENRRRSVIEDAKLRGNDFWATGNEPGWNLEIGPEWIVLRTDYGQTLYTMRTRKPKIFAEARRTTYEGHARGGDESIVDLRIVIEGTGCNDNMSGEAFESSVTVTIGEETLYGCGQALH